MAKVRSETTGDIVHHRDSMEVLSHAVTSNESVQRATALVIYTTMCSQLTNNGLSFADMNVDVT